MTHQPLDWHYSVNTNGLIPPVIACVLLSWIMFTGISGVLAERSPGIALTFFANNSDALARLALSEDQQKVDALKQGNNNSDPNGIPPSAGNPNPLPPSDADAVGTDALLAPESLLALPAEIVRKLALKAYAQEPLNVLALRALGFAEAKLGERDVAKDILNTVLVKSMRDNQSRIWLLYDSLKRESAEEAVLHIDMLFRVLPGQKNTLLSVISALADNKKSRPYILDSIKKNAPWRDSFLLEYARLSKNSDQLINFYNQLDGGLKGLDSEIIRSIVDALINKNKLEAAYYVWLQSLSEERIQNLPLLPNGDFESQPTGIVFDWYIRDITGARTEIAMLEDGGAKNNVLRISFFGERIMYRAIQKWLLLVPGRYKLSGKVKLDGLNSPRGLQWRIICLGQQRSLLAETERMVGTSTGWKGFELSFEIPQSDCTAQILTLQSAARNGPESIISGSAQFDELVIRRP